MFNTYEFTFAGESSVMYGLMVYDIGGRGQDEVSFGNTASIVETRTNNRIRPIHFGVNYHEKPLQLKLVFGSDRALDRYELEDVAMWLTGYQDYQWLSIDQPDMENMQFHKHPVPKRKQRAGVYQAGHNIPAIVRDEKPPHCKTMTITTAYFCWTAYQRHLPISLLITTTELFRKQETGTICTTDSI